MQPSRTRRGSSQHEIRSGQPACGTSAARRTAAPPPSGAGRSAVLSLAPVLTLGRDHFDSAFLIKMSVERVRVVRLVSFFLGSVSRSVCATLSPTGRSAPIAGSVHTRFGTADAYWAILAMRQNPMVFNQAFLYHGNTRTIDHIATVLPENSLHWKAELPRLSTTSCPASRPHQNRSSVAG